MLPQRRRKVSEQLQEVLSRIADLSGHTARLADKLGDMCLRLVSRGKEKKDAPVSTPPLPTDPADGFV